MYNRTALKDPIAKVLNILETGNQGRSRKTGNSVGKEIVYCWNSLNEDEQLRQFVNGNRHLRHLIRELTD